MGGHDMVSFTLQLMIECVLTLSVRLASRMNALGDKQVIWYDAAVVQ